MASRKNSLSNAVSAKWLFFWQGRGPHRRPAEVPADVELPSSGPQVPAHALPADSSAECSSRLGVTHPVGQWLFARNNGEWHR